MTMIEQNAYVTPVARKFLTAEWRYLAMINYEIDPAILLPFIPRGTELDFWNGKTYVSLVGFMFLNTRVLGLPIPFHINFEEVNLRYYVRFKSKEGWRRGVSFIKEIVPRFAIATVARVIYNENYVSMPMRHIIDFDQFGRLKENGQIEYGWFYNGRWNSLQVKTKGESRPMISGSEEEFITEHYWGYCSQRDGSSIEYQVEHPQWRAWQLSDFSLDCDFEQLYGREYSSCLSLSPTSAFLADGSAITVRKGQTIK
jgi:uncharacterized protein